MTITMQGRDRPRGGPNPNNAARPAVAPYHSSRLRAYCALAEEHSVPEDIFHGQNAATDLREAPVECCERWRVAIGHSAVRVAHLGGLPVIEHRDYRLGPWPIRPRHPWGWDS